ncbi:hypothetical protein [Chitinophaga sancti]|uniref:hypothetical protein n=1 Tax=Chitinophaga sancti TaxID=1004 RepID=UPI003F78E5C1
MQDQTLPAVAGMTGLGNGRNIETGHKLRQMYKLDPLDPIKMDNSAFTGKDWSLFNGFNRQQQERHEVSEVGALFIENIVLGELIRAGYKDNITLQPYYSTGFQLKYDYDANKELNIDSMTLRDIIVGIDTIDMTLTIYMQDLSNPASEAILLEQDEDGSILRTYNGQEYHYLLEVFLAKEIKDDFVVTQGRKPSVEEALNWVYDYGVNDG